MIKKFALTIFITLISLCIPLSALAQNFEPENVLDVNLVFEGGSVNITSIKKRQGFSPDYLNQPNSAYRLQVIDKSDIIAFEIKFILPTTYVQEGFENSSTPSAKVNSIEVPTKTITIPFFENAKEIKIINPLGEQAATQNLETITNNNIDKPQSSAKKTFFYLLGTILTAGIIGTGAYFIKKKIFPDEAKLN